MSNLVIRNGLVMDPANHIETECDVFIQRGRILAVGKKPSGFKPIQTIDATGMLVCPGLVDLSTRLREPGFSKKATIATELKAAVKGGITTICCLPDSSPVVDTPAVVEWIQQHSQKHKLAHVYSWGALTEGLEGSALSEMAALKEAGCIGVTNGLNAISNIQFLKQCYAYAASQNILVLIRPEEPNLVAGKVVHDGVLSMKMGLPSVSEIAETIALQQHIELIAATGVKAHFSGLSAKRSVAMIHAAKKKGLDITADVAIHQLHLTEQAIAYFNAQAHVRPPLRTQQDMSGLRKGVVSATIDCITSDHQPHDFAAKFAPFAATEPGISGFETLLALGLKLYHDGVVPLSSVIASLTCRPANRLHINAGTLSKDALADLCIIDINEKWTVDKQAFVSMGKNTPFEGWNLKGRVIKTLVNGQVVYSA